ncbi:MAG: GNAT family N-acetyltransferase [Lachnospiraceae bacterium]|nr:GNAT family N-acetyltransferase [Lachnospiraceae bacterium]
MLQIKRCSEADIVEVGAFYDKVVKHLCENINYPKWTYKEYPSEGSVREKTEAGCQFMCVEDGKVVGAFVLNADPQGKYENATWSRSLAEGEYMVCHALAADPQLQGKGIGSGMVAYCIEYAQKHGYKEIRLDVVPDNIPAKRLYEKCGFRYVGDVDLERNIEEIPLFSLYELEV